jgi:hypothetical protein
MADAVFQLRSRAQPMTTWNENLVYDIRMHRGEDTDFYERIGFNVIGFEANPHLIEQCKLRFQDAITTGRLRIAEDAVAPQAAGGRRHVLRKCLVTEGCWPERSM